MPDRLMGLAEVAELLGVSRQRADQLARTRGFPDPVATLVGGRIWERADVERWALDQGRICEMHKRPAKYRQLAHGRTPGYCDDCVPHNPPRQMVPGEPATKTQWLPEDLGMDPDFRA